MRKLALDLDGVFADFEKKVFEVCGFNYKDDPKNAWSTLDKVDHLFLSLDPLPGASLFFNIILNSLKDDVEPFILTALPLRTNKLVTAEEDKHKWVAEYLNRDIMVICTDGWQRKANYIDRSTYLVDDAIRNVRLADSVGGTGILHTQQSETLRRLEELKIIDKL